MYKLIIISLLLTSCSSRNQSESRVSALKQMASTLFHVDAIELDHSTKGVSYDYNDWKADPATGCKGYDGGHSGIDMQTVDVEGEATANRHFYSLSSGVVISAGADSFNTISIYNQSKNISVLYLHARKLYVQDGDRVKVGDKLGEQGNVGLGHSRQTIAEHVHLEVRDDRKKGPACGAITTLDPVLHMQ